MTTDGWLWYSLPDNTQEPGDTPCYMIMLLWGVFWDGAFNSLPMVLITLSREYNKKLFGHLFYPWWNCPLNILESSLFRMQSPMLRFTVKSRVPGPPWDPKKVSKMVKMWKPKCLYFKFNLSEGSWWCTKVSFFQTFFYLEDNGKKKIRGTLKVK